MKNNKTRNIAARFRISTYIHMITCMLTCSFLSRNQKAFDIFVSHVCVFFFCFFFSFQSGFILLRKNEERNIKKRRKNAKNNNLKTMLTFTYISSIEHLSWLCDKKRERNYAHHIYIYTHTYLYIYI